VPLTKKPLSSQLTKCASPFFPTTHSLTQRANKDPRYKEETSGKDRVSEESSLKNVGAWAAGSDRSASKIGPRLGAGLGDTVGGATVEKRGRVEGITTGLAIGPGWNWRFV